VFAILATLIVGVLVEIFVAVKIGEQIGALNTVLVLLFISLFGIWLTKRAGFAVLNRMRAQVQAGQMPTNEIIDGVLVLAGGLLLIIPGFVSDFFGLLLLFPPSRSLVRGYAKRRVGMHVQVYQIGGLPQPSVIDVDGEEIEG
jgi:UPF0716 protein FxsA